jgi:hypothetical protein
LLRLTRKAATLRVVGRFGSFLVSCVALVVLYKSSVGRLELDKPFKSFIVSSFNRHCVDFLVIFEFELQTPKLAYS